MRSLAYKQIYVEMDVCADDYLAKRLICAQSCARLKNDLLKSDECAISVSGMSVA